MVHRRHVAIYRDEARYPASPPYDPSERYPEYKFPSASAKEPNPVYRAVRSAMRLLGLDAAHFGSPAWNPLGDLIEPGQTVLLKPNFIRDFHDTRGDEIESLVTHGSVIRAVLDYVMIALRDQGRVVIADAPQSETVFERIADRNGLRAIQDVFQQNTTVGVEIVDLRPEYTEKVNGVIVGHRPLPGDPAGYRVVNLGSHSQFSEINHMNARLYGSEYDRGELAAHHHGDVHEYLISQTALDADVFINLPKMKTHKKVGVTLNLKGLVGINGNKNWLPHHREGVPADGGDQFDSSGLSQRLEHAVVSAFKKRFPRLGPLRRWVGGPLKRMGTAIFGDTRTNRVRSGNWYGNDTTWRMVLDLNRALVYADRGGQMQRTAQRRAFSIVDGIIAGEGNGPTGCDPLSVGLVVAGCDPLSVDLVCTRVMGLDYTKVPTLANALKDHQYALAFVGHDEIQCSSNVQEWAGRLCDFVGPGLAFRPHFGWKGHLELPEALSAKSNLAQESVG